MHIQEGTNTTLTTCTKMTEEVDRRHGVNGNGSSKAVSEDAPVHNSSLNASGGRLKFFKDGKFILELVRGCAREGERAGWVSVPRKTFWPPAGAPAPGTPPGAPPPSAPLSVSDDNSSVQSSPWQRDHCWKQQAPRKNLNKELAMYYCRPSTLATPAIEAESRARRRRPHLAARPDALRNGGPAPRRAPHLPNGLCDARRNGDADATPCSDDAVDGAPPRPTLAPPPDDDREKYYHMKLKKPYQYRKLRVYRKTRRAQLRKELERTIRKLHERLPAAAPAPAPPVNAKLVSCRQEHAIVSPRKRILRELERVSLEDGAKRRAKTAPALSTASYPPSPGPSHAAAPRAPPAEPPPPARHHPPKHVSSYSIHSLLSMPDESPPRRSPLAHPLPVKTEPACGLTSPAPSPSPEGYRYRVCGTPPLYRAGGAGGARGAWPGPAYRGARVDEWYAYPHYPYLAAHVYRAPPAPSPAPLWMYGAPHALAPPPVPSPWAPLPLPLLTDHIPNDEPTSDLPLNLSKH